MQAPLHRPGTTRKSSSVTSVTAAVVAIVMAVVMAVVTGCTTEAGLSATEPSAGPATATASSAAAPASTSTPTGSSRPSATDANGVVGTVLRFTSDRSSVDVTINQDSPAVRDLLSMMPLEVPVEEFSGREKIADLPRKLNIDDSPGSDPKDGDLIYYIPWGNLGFYYNASGVGFSDQTLHIGTYRASAEQLSQLEGDNVRVEIIP